MQDGLKTDQAFKGFRGVLENMSETLKPMKETMVRSFLTLMIQQVNKHNQRYLFTPKLVRAVFAEKETGQLVAKMLISDDESTFEKPTGKYKSKVHGCDVDLTRFATWLAMI